jgi:hypothetical protein
MEEQRDILTSILNRLLEKDGIEPGTITVLSPRRKEHSVVSTITIPVENYTLRARSSLIILESREARKERIKKRHEAAKNAAVVSERFPCDVPN